MDLLIAILMMMGVQATPASLNDKEFQDRNATQIKEAQMKADQVRGTDEEKQIIVTTSTGNG